MRKTNASALRMLYDSEAATRGVPQKKLSINISQYLKKTPVLESLGLQLYEKETPTQVFSCDYCEIFKNSFL